MSELRIDRRQFFGSAALLGGFAATPAFAQALVRAAPQNWAAVQALLDSYVAEDKAPGTIAAVARGTDDPQFLASGKIGRGRDRAVDADTLYRVYSMSKPITGIAAMMLIQDGKLRLDQDIGDFIPSFRRPMVAIDPEKSLDARPASSAVTVRNLMTHTSGLGYIINTKGALQKEYARLGLIGAVVSRQPIPGFPPVTPAPSLKDFAERIGTLPLVYQPNTRWHYAAGLDVLGYVVEAASGMPFATFLRERLFAPLGMNSSYFVMPESELPRLTTNYGIAGGKQFPIDGENGSIYTDPTTPALGGGGLVMSARDYDRFLLMLAGYGAIGSARVMRPDTARLAMSDLMLPSVDRTAIGGQGFGAGGRVTIKPDPNGSGVGTFGWGGAAGTIAWVDPTKRVRASGYVQYMPSETYNFSRDLGKAVYASL